MIGIEKWASTPMKGAIPTTAEEEQMENKYFVLFLRHEWDRYDGKEYQDYLAGVFSSHARASAEGRRLIDSEPDFYCRFYVVPCDLDKTI